MNEEMDSDVVHEVGLGKGGRFACEPSHSLAQGAIETLDVVGWPTGIGLVELLLGHHTRIRFPNIGKAASVFVGRWDAAPQHAAGFHAAAPDGISHDLACASAQS